MPATVVLSSGGSRSARFHTTRWTVVLAAQDQEGEAGQQALSLLCREYWYPLYAFVRRSGSSAEDAKDLTQAFFARLLEKDYLSRADREKGRFRTFLLVALKRFLANEWHKAHTRKRGGALVHLSIDTREAEDRYLTEPADPVSPETLYDRRWAYTLIDRALERLRREFREVGREAVFDGLKDSLTGADPAAYAEVAKAIGLSEGATRVAVHRMRRRFGQLFREELAETVTPENVQEEMRHLRQVLSR